MKIFFQLITTGVLWLWAAAVQAQETHLYVVDASPNTGPRWPV